MVLIVHLPGKWDNRHRHQTRIEFRSDATLQALRRILEHAYCQVNYKDINKEGRQLYKYLNEAKKLR